MACTWVDCKSPAVSKKIADDGEVWANLCREHADKLEIAEAQAGSSPGLILSAWVKAQGGSKKATERMMRSE